MPLPRPLRDLWLSRLVARARRGDREAFVRLYRALHPAVWGFAARRLRARADAEELVSLTFHRLLEALPGLDPSRPVLAYALAIARNALADGLRARRPDAPLSLAGEVAAAGTDPLAGLLSAEAAGALRAELARLPPEERELLTLRFGDGLRFAEIGAVLGLAEPAVRKRCSRAVAALRAALGPPADREEGPRVPARDP